MEVVTRIATTEHEHLTVTDVRCGRGRSRWSPTEEAIAWSFVFVRSGCFTRRVNGVETLVDAAVVYARAPGEEQQVAHPCDGGDTCTVVRLSDRAIASVWGGDVDLESLLVYSTPEIDLQHRLLLRLCRVRTDELELEERLWAMISAVVERVAPGRVGSGRPATARGRRVLVDAARERLTTGHSITLTELGRELAVSPHHLSRVFHALTGETVSRYRNRIRVRHALERLAEGERSLTRLAAELGFSDHAHLTRVVRAETGAPPSLLRAALSTTGS